MRKKRLPTTLNIRLDEKTLKRLEIFSEVNGLLKTQSARYILKRKLREIKIPDGLEDQSSK